MSKFKVFT